MKTGIITILKVNNYGAELQAYALHQKLKNLGFDNEIIDYLYFKNRRFKASSKSKPMVKVSNKEMLKSKVLALLDRYNEVRFPSIYKKRIANFDRFHSQNTKLSPTFRSMNELYQKAPAYDTYIVGSDQVWNPMTQSSIEPYFLTFVKNGKRKLAYASSFGVQQIKAEDQPVYREKLNNLDLISCREKTGVKLVKELTGRDAQHVLDPTLLLSQEEWNQVAVPSELKEPYILIYELTNSSYIREFAAHLKAKTGCRIVRICKDVYPKESDDEILNIRDAGPAEYLGLFAGAKLVLTNSFHGTIFSIIYKKPFYTIPAAKKKNNSRQKDLLDLLGLEDRMLPEGSSYPNEDPLDIDYMAVNSLLEQAKKESTEYLINALK